MMLKIFHYAQYFSESSAIYPNSKVLSMGSFPHDLIRVVGGSEMFTEIRGSRLRLFGFGNRFLLEWK
jgi:hypothetical protein